MNMASEVYEMNLEEENERLKAEIDALKESIKEHDKWEKEEAIAFAVIKEEWRTQIIEKKVEIDELKKALESMTSKYSYLLISNKHREK